LLLDAIAHCRAVIASRVSMMHDRRNSGHLYGSRKTETAAHFNLSGWSGLQPNVTQFSQSRGSESMVGRTPGPRGTPSSRSFFVESGACHRRRAGQGAGSGPGGPPPRRVGARGEAGFSPMPLSFPKFDIGPNGGADAIRRGKDGTRASRADQGPPTGTALATPVGLLNHDKDSF